MSNTELGAINTASTGGVTPVENSTYQSYSYSFTASQTSEYLSFLFRNDPGFTWLDTVSVVPNSGGANMLTDGGFDSGPGGFAANGSTVSQSIPIGWTAIGTQGLQAAGAIGTNASNQDGPSAAPQAGPYFWVDGAVAGYDGLSQQMTLTIGITYTLSFELAVDAQGAPDTNGPDSGIDTQVWVGPTVEAGSIACFAGGTRILTDAGEVAVEALRAGDLVMTVGDAASGLKPIRWVGYSRVNLDRHPAPDLVEPIRVRAGAFDDGVPHRDLWLSPEHAVAVRDDDGVALIPIYLLVNGATILREPARGTVTYYHVELDRHDLLMAEGLAAESYLDTGNRDAFANGGAGVMLHPNFGAGGWERRACVPGVLAGPRLRAEHARLLALSVALGHRLTDDAGLRIVADGVTLASETTHAGTMRSVLPAGASDIRLISRSMVPHELDRSLDDRRHLGVAVMALRHGGHVLPLDGDAFAEGFHARGGNEAWRWTDGAATLRLTPVAGASMLELQFIAGLGRYCSMDGADTAHAAAA